MWDIGMAFQRWIQEATQSNKIEVFYSNPNVFVSKQRIRWRWLSIDSKIKLAKCQSVFGCQVRSYSSLQWAWLERFAKWNGNHKRPHERQSDLVNKLQDLLLTSKDKWRVNQPNYKTAALKSILHVWRWLRKTPVEQIWTSTCWRIFEQIKCGRYARFFIRVRWHANARVESLRKCD